MGYHNGRRDLQMTDDLELPWVKLAAVAGGVLALAVVVRGVTAVARIAWGEASYRAGDPDTWLKWVK